MSPSATADGAIASPAASHSQSMQPETTEAATLDTLPGPDHHWRVALPGKVIAITGANRGIGLGIAQVCLANEAAAVYSLDLFEPAEEFQAVREANPKRLHYLNCNVTSEESISKAIDAIVSQQGAIHGLVANAGMTKHQPALDFSRAQLEQLFNLNVFGAYHCATIAAKKFIELGVKGSIVFTASMTSYRPNRAAPSAPCKWPLTTIWENRVLRRILFANQCHKDGATKGAVRNMTHTMAMEWAKHGIRVNCVSPGFVKTAMTYFVDQAPDWKLKMQYYGGMPRLADPKELGGAYVYLLSDGASYTTGIDIPVAGIVGAW